MNKPQGEEHSMGFLEAEASTGEELSSLILQRLKDMTIPFEDCKVTVIWQQGKHEGQKMYSTYLELGSGNKIFTLFTPTDVVDMAIVSLEER